MVKSNRLLLATNSIRKAGSDISFLCKPLFYVNIYMLIYAFMHVTL